jgi:hypothetical protein
MKRSMLVGLAWPARYLGADLGQILVCAVEAYGITSSAPGQRELQSPVARHFTPALLETGPLAGVLCSLQSERDLGAWSLLRFLHERANHDDPSADRRDVKGASNSVG